MKINLTPKKEQPTIVNIIPKIQNDIIKKVNIEDIKLLAEKDNIATLSIIALVNSQSPLKLKVDQIDKDDLSIEELNLESIYDVNSVIEFVIELVINDDHIECSDVLASNIIEFVDDNIKYKNKILTKEYYEKEIESIKLRDLLKGDGKYSVLSFNYLMES